MGVDRKDLNKVPANRPPEDKMLQKNTRNNDDPSVLEVQNQSDWSISARVNKVFYNDSENDPYFLIIYLGGSIWFPSNVAQRLIIYGCLYLTGRIMHNICYIKGIQPWRSIGWTLGLGTTLAMNIDLIIRTSQVNLLRP